MLIFELLQYCYVCKLNAPPRAYHCHLCNACILKRDHHCPFAGCCIGYHNHRYYFWAVVYATLGSAFVLWFHWTFIWWELGGLRLSTFWVVIVPQIALLGRFISLWQFLLAGILMTSVVSLMFSVFLLGTQIVCISRGQTQHELKEGIRQFDLGFRRNWAEVLGPHWFITTIFPWARSELPGDGLRFLPNIDTQSLSKDF